MKKAIFMLAFALTTISLFAQKTNVKNGYSTYTYASGERFEGHWNNNVIDGTGVYYWSANHFYVGHWKNGKRHGYGVEVFENGSYQIKYFENDKSMTRKIGSTSTINTGVGIYQGEMRGNKACGNGTFRWNNGQWFEGEWDCTRNSRSGVLYYSNTTNPWKIGEWVNDKMEGYGCIIEKDGITVGFWKSGELISSTKY